MFSSGAQAQTADGAFVEPVTSVRLQRFLEAADRDDLPIVVVAEDGQPVTLIGMVRSSGQIKLIASGAPFG